MQAFKREGLQQPWRSAQVCTLSQGWCMRGAPREQQLEFSELGGKAGSNHPEIP